MKNACVTLVEPKQIAKKGYQGCKSTKTVVQFARKYGVPTLWWKPTNGHKVLLIEPTQFGQTWKQVQGGKTGTKTTRATGSNGTKKTNTMWKRTTGTNTRSAWGGTSTRSNTKKNGTTRSTTYGKGRTNTTNKTSGYGTYGRTANGTGSGNGTRKMMSTTKHTMGKNNTRRTTKSNYRRAA